jgi:hypothetical protein
MTKFIGEKPRTDSRFMSPDEAMRALNKAGKLHKGEISLPSEIVKLKALIEAKTRNAELFAEKFRVVDEGMLREIVQLKLQLDGLYTKWGLE